jgi:hypothetical protein
MSMYTGTKAVLTEEFAILINAMLYIYMYTYMYIYIHICTYMYIYTFICFHFLIFLGTKGVLTEEFAILIEAMWTTANKARNKTPNQTNSNIYKRPLRYIY